MGRSLIAGAIALVVIAASGVAALVLGNEEEAYACGAFGPFDFTTYEVRESVPDFKEAIGLAAEGRVVSGTFDVIGETVNLVYQGLEVGDRAARDNNAGSAAYDTSKRIPPLIYYSIAWIEANWQHASNSVPWGGIGSTIRSFDCGYGIGQITTGMRNESGTPSAKQALVGTNYLYNLAEGMRILADKWNSAPQFRPIAGNGDPEAIEDWYYAIWSYNGFAFVNHPFNPNLNPLRGGGAESPLYHCYNESAPSYSPSFGFGNYTYNEKVHGCMKYPPERDNQPIWEPVEFNLPDFAREEVAAAFDPAIFLQCSAEDDFIGGCAGMDFPTSFPDEQIETTKDPSPPSDPSRTAQLLGSPSLTFSGPAAATLEARGDGTIDSFEVLVTNAGTGLGTYRVRTSDSWLVAREPGNSASRTLDAGIAVGSNVEVVLGGGAGTTMGHQARVIVTLDPEGMPAGPVSASITFEPLLAGGQPFTVVVEGVNNYIPPTPTPTPTPVEDGGGETPTPEPFYRSVAPALSSAP